MKICPECNRTYSDDSLSFCLEDGMLLSPTYDSGQTLVMGEPRPLPQNQLEITKLSVEKVSPLSISVRDGNIFINGGLLRLPTTVEIIESILGVASRREVTKSPMLNSHLWDESGLYCSESKNTFEVFLLGMTLNRVFNEWETNKSYKGELIVDGARVDGKSTLFSINQTKSGKPFLQVSPDNNRSWLVRYEENNVALYTSERQVVAILTVALANPPI